MTTTSPLILTPEDIARAEKPHAINTLGDLTFSLACLRAASTGELEVDVDLVAEDLRAYLAATGGAP